VADHVEKGARINVHKIKCKGGESTAEQISLITKAFTKPMGISEWQQESDGLIHIQCRRVEFIGIQFKLGDEPWRPGNKRERTPSTEKSDPQSCLKREFL
jgi:hypothetical protein